jgi:hypothetical protein
LQTKDINKFNDKDFYLIKSVSSCLIREILGGPWYTKAVYICTRLAPALIFSYASFPVNIPPTPIIVNFPGNSNSYFTKDTFKYFQA